MELIVRSGPDAGATASVDRRITIGREGDFLLSDPTISRLHAAITPTGDGQRALLEDLGSTGGTVVNGTRLFGPVTLQGGEQILMGSSILELVVAAAVAHAPAPEPQVVAAVPEPPAIPLPPTPSPVIPPLPAPEAGGGGRNRKLLVIAIVIALVVIAAVAGFLVLSGGDDEAEAGGGGGGGGATGATTPVSNLAATPGEFSADPASWTVSLAWDPAADALSLDHYQVTRDGDVVADDLAETSFVDEGLEPGGTVDYAVVAIGANGTTDPAEISAKTPKLPLSEALLVGKWAVDMTVTKSNLDDIGTGSSMRWEFGPTCAFGPCDVTWSVAGKPTVGVLSPVGASYEGSGLGPFLIRSCKNEVIDEEITISLKVTDAEAATGVFEATAVKGTLTETARSPGCITAIRTFTFTGLPV